MSYIDGERSRILAQPLALHLSFIYHRRDRASTSVAPMGLALLAMRAYLAAAGMALSLVAVWASIVFASNAQVILAL